MSAIDDQTRLRHIRDAAKKVIAYAAETDRESLSEDEMRLLALVRLVEIIGEASARLSDDLKARHTAIPWTAIVGMRHRLVHAYFDIDLDVLWNTVTVAVPELLTDIERILDEEGD